MTSGWWSRTQGHKQYLSWRIKSSRSFFFLLLYFSNCFFWSPHRQLVLSIVTAQQSLMLLIHKVGCLGLFLCNYWICLRKWLCTITLKHQMSFDQTDWNQWMENQMTMNTLGERKYSCYEVMESVWTVKKTLSLSIKNVLFFCILMGRIKLLLVWEHQYFPPLGNLGFTVKLWIISAFHF